ncbi:MAG: hypothetical protein H8E40_12490 [Chloroflexi bacterium]|nr:hypothetical protein [Chloroflexota bacterium]
MRKVVTFFVFSLVAFIGILIGDALDKSEYIIKTNDDLLNKTVQTAQTVEKYYSIAEWLTGLTGGVPGD